MKKIFLAIMAILLVSSTLAAAADIQVLSVSVKEHHWWSNMFGSELAIGTDKSVYNPGEVAKLTIVSDVPCNSAYVFLNVLGPNVIPIYRQDISSLFKGNCFTSQITTYLGLPNYGGAFNVFIEYQDAAKKIIYSDAAVINVKDISNPITCPNTYCTNWVDSGKTTNGKTQTKSCYTYDKVTCKQSVLLSSRTVCDSGFNLVSGQCRNVATNPVVCGNGKLEADETCDLGSSNGACPSKCSSLCQTNACTNVPPTMPPPGTTDGTGFKIPVLLWVAIGGVLLAGGGLLWKRFG